MKDLATAYMTRRYARGGRVGRSCMNEGGEVILSPAEKIKKALTEPTGTQNAEKGLEEYLPPMDKPKKMAMGGMINDEEDMNYPGEDVSDIDVRGDLDDEMDDLYEPKGSNNQDGSGLENMKDQGMMKKRFVLSKILGGVMKFHTGR